MQTEMKSYEHRGGLSQLRSGSSQYRLRLREVQSHVCVSVVHGNERRLSHTPA